MAHQHEHPVPTQPTHTPARGERDRFVDPEQLVCPGCWEQVRPEPPGYWHVADGLPTPQFSHHDATALCRRVDGTVAEPIEIEAPA